MFPLLLDTFARILQFVSEHLLECSLIRLLGQGSPEPSGFWGISYCN